MLKQNLRKRTAWKKRIPDRYTKLKFLVVESQKEKERNKKTARKRYGKIGTE